jgi:hypothetical protein
LGGLRNHPNSERVPQRSGWQGSPPHAAAIVERLQRSDLDADTQGGAYRFAVKLILGWTMCNTFGVRAANAAFGQIKQVDEAQLALLQATSECQHRCNPEVG